MPSNLKLNTTGNGASVKADFFTTGVAIDIANQIFSASDLDELLEFLLKIREDMEVPF